ncbi:DUF2274 domain-containing protein [Asticcacaulis benevestitus]|uniref:Protein involved in integration/excision of ICE Tn4371 family n=1 Tax=Asticcacaulis benevestitus DSM 16100 = ATCC BAA-896 TaxID=1121022 RepID=V4PV86_9CAUL|nr:DUF2274 domain-containing protein [Asticcacaulis benevestitus]ESQ89490.1 hypothetical protein ABENE_14010 [Asticcacaulis benevestitus DSM 16100 = ATCC BAA-896]
MAKLKIGALPDDKPVRVTTDLPAETHRDLVAYAKALETETGKAIADPARLIPVMLDRFMASDRAFTKSSRRAND